MPLPLFFLLALLPALAWSQMAILEVDDSDNTDNHDELVMELACAHIPQEDCKLFWISSRRQDDLKDLVSRVAQAEIINMSIGFQRPILPTTSRHSHRVIEGNDYPTQLAEYEERMDAFKPMIYKSPQSLFVSAAGNGITIGNLWTDGRPLGHRYKVYPAFFTSPNNLVVAALESIQIEGQYFSGSRLAAYTNYGVEYVDIAAPTQVERSNQLLKGSSFAAPYVASLAYEFKKRNPKLRPEEIKEIFLKSAEVIEIDRAIEVSQEFAEKGEDSLLGKLEKVANHSLRSELLKRIGPIMHVRSGGPLREGVARRCAELYAKNFGSIEASCLQAQVEQLHIDSERFEKLKTLWRIRKI